MIPDEVLRNAAARSWEAYLSQLLDDYNPDMRFDISPGFEKKIRKLKRRADHPVFYSAIRRIAAVLLALIIGGIAWLSIDSSARASFFGWVLRFSL